MGGVEILREFFNFKGVEVPSLDYPESLSGFLNRKIWKTTLGHIKSHLNDHAPFFLKSVEHKRITGFLCSSVKSLIPLSHMAGDVEIWCSEVLPFESEYRCYVLENDLLGVHHYKGNPWLLPDIRYVDRMIRKFSKEAPKAYSLDVGVHKGRVSLIEVNDSFALGNYGLSPRKHAEMVEARWREILALKKSSP